MLGKITKIKIFLAIAMLGLFLSRDFISTKIESIKNDSQSDAAVGTTKKEVVDKININKKQIVYSKAKVAILIQDLGLQRKILDNAIRMDKNFSLGITPYADNFSSITNESLDAKHDTLMLIPTQSINYSSDDPGPYALLTTLTPSQNNQLFSSLMNRVVTNDIALYLAPSTIFTIQRDRAMNIIRMFEENNEKFKYLVYYSGGRGSVFSNLLQHSNIKNKVIAIERVLDSDLDAEKIRSNLDRLVKIASSRNEIATGMISSMPISTSTVQKWLEENSDTVELVPLSTVVKTKDSKL